MVTKTICKMKKRVEENIKYYSKIVSEPKFICNKCARVSNDSEYLCKPIKLKK